jgi:pimeloyl-ACP methyl ester carboxylesterase
MLGDGTAVSVRGAGQPVVLLHGVGLRKAMWEPVTNVLASSFTVITYDLLGHGRSRRIDDSATLDDFIAQLDGVLDAFECRMVRLVGFSFGGLISQRYARDRSERLERLVLMNTVYNRTDEEAAAVRGRFSKAREEGTTSIIPSAIARWFSPAFVAGQPDVIGGIERGLRDNDPQSFLAAYRLFCDSNEDMQGCLKGLTVPTLAITGELDTGSTPAMVDRMVADLENGEGRVIAGARHMMPVELAGEVTAAILPFLTGHEGKG